MAASACRPSAAALLLALALGLAGCAGPAAQRPDFKPPEVASGWTAKPGWSATRFMVAAAHPLATEAGHGILRAGGSALDAAIAAQMVLTLVEPQSSGIGGGAFLMHWDGREVQAWDGRETAPAAAHGRLMLDADGQPLPAAQAVFGGRAVGTPGLLKMLEAAHREHGQLPWARLFEPAIALAEGGFAITSRLHASVAANPHLRRDQLARRHFFDAQGAPHPVGHVLRNPALAAVLRAVAEGGSAAFYTGPVAAAIAQRVRGHAVRGLLSEADLAAYEARRRDPICSDWPPHWRVCGFPPPSSGHLTVMQILGLLAHAPVAPAPARGSPPGPDWLHVYTEASRLAFADRALYIGDPDFVAAPDGGWTQLLDPVYLRERAALIDARQRMPSAKPGKVGARPTALAPTPEQPEQGTSHISVVDGQGRALALTTTIESFFGARVMSDGGTGLPGGFLLNNQLTDFAARPTDAQGRPVANRIQPGKRPRSSMSPTLVFDRRDGRLAMTLGSPGGLAIIPYVSKTLIGTLQWGLDMQRAIDLPNFAALGGPLLLETGRFPAATLQTLRERGHTVQEVELTSGLQGIERRGDGWFGGADPRREGVAGGD